MKKVNRRKMEDSTHHNVWRSYSDMMSGLLLLFVLIMAVCLMQAQKNYTEKLNEQAKQLQTQNELNKSQTQLNEQSAQLSEQSAQLENQQNTLDEQADKLSAQQSTLDEQAAALADLQTQLSEQASELEQKEADLSASQTQLDQQNTLLTSQQAKLDEQTALMAEQQQKIDQIIGVKADLIASLNEEFEANQISVEIDKQTGAMVLDSSVLFDYNASELKEEGAQILAQVLPVYCKVLLSEEYEPYLAEIIIDGYTDSSGGYISNLDLSQRRAFAVAEYLVNNKDSFLDESQGEVLMEKLTANGRSQSNPVLDANGNEDMEASRRVEIKFRLKDEEMISSLQQMLEESAAANGQSTADASNADTQSAAETQTGSETVVDEPSGDASADTADANAADNTGGDEQPIVIQ